MLQLSLESTRGESTYSRRAFLRTSLLTAGAFGLPTLLQRQATAASRPRRDTAVIQLWLGGGPSHLDMYDLKPAAPAEIRGSFKPIKTNVPGIDICELLPLQARMMDRLAVIRSLHHSTNEHPQGAHWAQTGYFSPLIEPAGEPTHPSAGSITSLLRGPNRRGMVPYVHIAPDPMGFPVFVKVHDSGYLGPSYDPFRIESVRAKADPNRLDLNNLIGKVQFKLPNLELCPGLDAARLDDRDTLRRRMDRLGRLADSPGKMPALDKYHRKALELVTSASARAAFDLNREDPKLRERYGMNSWGQGLLLCRRLVEAGVTFVTLNTDAFSGQWDNHANLANDFRKMLPVYDQMLTALIEDLVNRGLYERVLVVVWGEFGRTPKINSAAGRDHWGASGCALLGGGGLRGGVVVGSTNPRGEEPKERTIWPHDVLATVYHVLGIDQNVELTDKVGRPVKVLASGEPIREVI